VTRALRFNTLSSVMLIVGSMIDELLRLACLPFLPTKLARLRCVLVSHCVELIRYGPIKALPRELVTPVCLKDLRLNRWTGLIEVCMYDLDTQRDPKSLAGVELACRAK